MSSAPQESSRSELHPAVRIGHVHLRVADLDRAMSFYRDVLGFELTAYGADFGLPGAAFLAAGDYPERGVGNPQGRTIRSSGSIGGVGPDFLVPIHRSAWKRNPANFAFIGFAEIPDSQVTLGANRSRVL